MKTSLCIFTLVTILMGVESNAEETNNFKQSSESAERPWYAGIVTSYLIASGDANFYGNTQSIYGGSPTFGMDDGRALSLTFGRDFSDGWRLQGQISYQNMQSNVSPVSGFDDRSEDLFAVDAEIESTLLMLNGFYDFDIGANWFKPYLKGGIGVSRNKTTQANIAVEYNSAIWDGSVLQGQFVDDIQYPEGKSTEFAWNIGAGLVFDVSENFDLSFEYGFLDLGEALTETTGGGDALGWSDLSAQSISLGIDYRF
jgi:opacity protein-like surface antigen